jgi:hypothetical protein
MSLLLVGVAAASPATALSARVAVPLYATVGAGTIKLTNSTGGPIRRLRVGVYRIVVSDRSSHRNFHLVGPTKTVDRATTLAFVGKVVWTLRLAKGRYRFYSDRYPSLRGTFTVT